MAKLNPHVRFNDGKCREGMDFYKSCFGGKLEIMTIGDTPQDALDDMKKQMPAMPPMDYVMHASLVSGDLTLTGSDMMRDKAIIGDGVSIIVNCKDKKEVDDLFAKIGAGGEVFMKPDDTFWGAYFGMVTDKYGVEWSFNFQKTPSKS